MSGYEQLELLLRFVLLSSIAVGGVVSMVPDISRYLVDETDDGLSGEEGTFTICSFWLVSALIEVGEFERGRELCERILSLASPLQLYAEELDPRSGRHLGNFPQAFTHLALINAVMKLIAAEEEYAAGHEELDAARPALAPVPNGNGMPGTGA